MNLLIHVIFSLMYCVQCTHIPFELSHFCQGILR